MIVDKFIDWAMRRGYEQPIVTFDDEALFTRFEFWRRDEWPDSWWDEHREQLQTRPRRLPWWCPINAFLHRWEMRDGVAESFHDHPRWSVTLCLKGRLVEMTPWGERELRPGSVVIRSHRAIHAFRKPDGCDEAWTVFIVGRRKHRQNSFVVTKR